MNKEVITTLKLFGLFIGIQIICAVCISITAKYFATYFYFLFFGLQIPILYSNYIFFKRCLVDIAYFKTFQLIYYLLFLLSVTSIFSYQYEILQRFDERSFHIQNSSGNISFDLWYFSIVTFTTVGYGDITPVTIPAKILTIIEIISSLTLLILVVSNFHSFFKKPKPTNKLE